LGSFTLTSACFCGGHHLAIGLIVTAGLGLFVVGPLNPISLAFAILFIGLSADFAVQFSLRYRAQQYLSSDLREALLEAAERVGVPLTLAAAAAAVAFCRSRDAYTGLAQLGKIAGCGMIVAYFFTFTLLPALVRVAHHREAKAVGQPAWRRWIISSNGAGSWSYRLP